MEKGEIMAEKMDRELFKKYHCAVVKSNLDNVEKLKARIGSEWAGDFLDKAGKIEGDEEFCRGLEKYLEEDLCLCESVQAEETGSELAVTIKGCHICFGNEELRRQELPAMCPIIPTGLQSLSKVHGRKASLQGVEKTGVVGECTIRYALQ
jgi:hypothetical protein